MARKVSTLVPYFGSNRTLAANVGALLKGCKWVGVPFAGGMCELAHIDAPTLVVSDLHRWVINLARVVADDDLRELLIKRLDGKLFHPDQLAASQRAMRDRVSFTTFAGCEFPAAVDYFVCAWMGRSAKAGTNDEFTGKLPIRMNGNGGDSNTRYRSAVAALEEWGRVFRRCNFHVRDAFDFIPEVNDDPTCGLYIDAPWPDDGDSYRHPFDEKKQRRLAQVLTTRFHLTRLVVRFGDHPLIRDLYPESLWTWHRQESRTAGNNPKAEVLIVRNMP